MDQQLRKSLLSEQLEWLLKMGYTVEDITEWTLTKKPSTSSNSEGLHNDTSSHGNSEGLHNDTSSHGNGEGLHSDTSSHGVISNQQETLLASHTPHDHSLMNQSKSVDRSQVSSEYARNGYIKKLRPILFH